MSCGSSRSAEQLGRLLRCAIPVSSGSELFADLLARLDGEPTPPAAKAPLKIRRTRRDLSIGHRNHRHRPAPRANKEP